MCDKKELSHAENMLRKAELGDLAEQAVESRMCDGKYGSYTCGRLMEVGCFMKDFCRVRRGKNAE